MKFIIEFMIIAQIAFMLIPLASAFAGKSKQVSKPAKENDIAVVKGRFDRIEKTLKIYRIPYTTLTFSDLEKETILSKYRAIFLPCGIGSHVETNVNILSRGTSVQAVFLKEDFFEIDLEKIYSNIKSYIEKGGNVYCSGYSYEFIHEAFHAFEFFNDFPNMGSRGKIELELKNDLKTFCRRKNMRGYVSHSGWIAVKSIKDADVLAEGIYKTINGEISGPIVALLKRGDGEAIYTSYHKKRGFEELSRYIVYRVVYRFLLDILVDEAHFWDQEIRNTIIDSIRGWERCRIYPIPITIGMTTIYFTSEKGFFQIDLFDKDNNLITSRDIREKNFSIDINSDIDDYFILRVYPSIPRKHGAYSIVIAQGLRIFPYYKKVLLVLLFGAIVLMIYWIKGIVGPRKFSGKIRRKK